jgi:hypothetical protein
MQLTDSAPPVTTPAKSSLATAGLVCGIVGACIGLIPILGIFALPLGILAIIFGIVARKRRKGFAYTALATGVLALVLSICGMVIVSNAVNSFDHCTKAVSADLHNGTNTADTVCSK